jgi:hypothetical protein
MEHAHGMIFLIPHVQEFFFFFFYAFEEGWIGAWARKPASCPVSFTLAGAARGHGPTIGSLELDCLYFLLFLLT